MDLENDQQIVAHVLWGAGTKTRRGVRATTAAKRHEISNKEENGDWDADKAYVFWTRSRYTNFLFP